MRAGGLNIMGLSDFPGGIKSLGVPTEGSQW